MRQKSDAQKYLEQVEKIDAIITNKLIEKQQWRDIAMGITANMGGERVQSSGCASKMAEAIEKCVDMEAEIDRLVDKLIEIKKDVISTLEQLESPADYRLLHDRYIKFMDLTTISERWNRDYTTITTAHGRAIVEVQRILDKRNSQM